MIAKLILKKDYLLMAFIEHHVMLETSMLKTKKKNFF